MFSRIKLVNVELSQPLPSFSDLDGYGAVWGLVRWRGRPIGRVWVPTSGGTCSATAIADKLFPDLTWSLLQALVAHQLQRPDRAWDLPTLLEPPPLAPVSSPTITLAYCLSHRQNLAAAWQAIAGLKAADSLAEVLIVESLPIDSWVKDQIQQTYPHWRYLAVQEPGLNAARNAALAAASGDWIAFSDTRAWPDAQWIQALAHSITAHPSALARTGQVLHSELEQSIQKRFEDGGHSLERGFEPCWYRLGAAPNWTDLGTTQVGSGVNMAFERRLLERLGGFDPALDQGGDLDLFWRVLRAGETIWYEPSILVRYAVPSQDSEIQSWLQADTAGFYAYIRRSWQRYPDLRPPLATLALWKLARLGLTWLRPGHNSRSWIGAALQGALQGIQPRPRLGSELKPDRQSEFKPASAPELKPDRQSESQLVKRRWMAVREVDLASPLQPLLDIGEYDAVRIYLRQGERPLGELDIATRGSLISVERLAQAIAAQGGMGLLAQLSHLDPDTLWNQISQEFVRHWTPPAPPEDPQAAADRQTLPLEVPVSVIITTCDRPADLAHCLKHLLAQKTDRPFEIIVADNRPGSGLTPPVVAQFPQVRYVAEPRPGGSYGRNAAFVASQGDIVVTVDDDVTVPPDWLEKLLAPMHRPEVMVVTGNVLPLELETKAQWMFETLKGGLGEGFKAFEVDGNWLASFDRSPPTWDLGVSANSAFRASIFAHPQIGMMDEVLGPGTPTVGGEENHLIYKVLRAGYTLVYEPSAYVWHRHRRDLKGLYKQIYGHMKGGTAYHLLLWLQEKDPRGRDQLFVGMPNYLKGYCWDRLRGRHQTPWRIMWSEVAGYVAGFWGYWQSVQRLKQLGRSAPYVPVARRSPASAPADLGAPSSTRESAESAQETL
jgi:O-antigen biosynthesis protein